ncbi:alpha/beta hydrolase [Paenibacillus sp. FSL P4-0338]|uniref:alpha/beta fold hydrolase n=1 Tax=unclassified Paenibacillus TaxID=185978 RepID=UPI0003E203A8|nr:alpha/beta hydrolase [Paenibacillus sp. FSL R7-269]ETT32948.1 aromatic hydrocarbon catabolism protein [Paenibacillus sp. FSL R7-269]
MPRIAQTFKLETGADIEYTVVGRGEPVFILHGGHSNCQEDFGYKILLENGYSIITPSRPGYGRTSNELGSSLDAACKAYEQLLDHLNLTKVHIIAVSAGGPSGLTFAARYPHRVHSLTLQSAVSKAWHSHEDTTYKAAKRLFHPRTEKYTWKLLSVFSRSFPNFILKQMVPSFSSLPVSQVMQQFTQEDVKQFAAMNQRQRSGHGFMLDLEQLAWFEPSGLPAILCPTLIIHSKYDQAVLPAHAYAAFELIPQAELCLFESWGHLIWLGKDADTMNRKLIDFLNITA